MKRIVEIGIEIAVGLFVLAAIVAYAFRLPPDEEFDGRWLGLVVITLVIFGYLLYWFRRLFGLPLFWIAFASSLVVHIAVLVLLVQQIEKFPLVIFAGVAIAEWAVLCPLMDRIGNGK